MGFFRMSKLTTAIIAFLAIVLFVRHLTQFIVTRQRVVVLAAEFHRPAPADGEMHDLLAGHFTLYRHFQCPREVSHRLLIGI